LILVKTFNPFCHCFEKGSKSRPYYKWDQERSRRHSPSCIDIKKEVEVVLVSFEIKEEIEELEEVNIMHNRIDMNGIPKPVLKYIIKYSKYLHCHWVQQLVILKMPLNGVPKSSWWSNFKRCHPKINICL